jgi:Skp family chaperone for outer membrane proteins
MQGRALAVLAAFVLSTGELGAQEATPVPQFPLAGEQGAVGPLREPLLRSPVVTLDRERLFAESLMGQAMIRRLDAESNDLIAENRRLEQALEQEERDLTEKRKTLPQDKFRTLSVEFDQRVEELRQAQDAKSRALTRQRDVDRQTFFEAAVPILGQLMSEIEAVAIIDRSAIILTFDKLDITTLAVERLDADLGEGPSDLGVTPEAAPDPGPDPAQAAPPSNP